MSLDATLHSAPRPRGDPNPTTSGETDEIRTRRLSSRTIGSDPHGGRPAERRRGHPGRPGEDLEHLRVLSRSEPLWARTHEALRRTYPRQGLPVRRPTTEGTRPRSRSPRFVEGTAGRGRCLRGLRTGCAGHQALSSSIAHL